MEMDWNKMGAIGSIGSFIVSVAIVFITIWPWPQVTAARHGVSVFQVSGGTVAISVFLVLGFLLAGFSLYMTGRNNRKGKSVIRFYENRTQLHKDTQNLQSELEGMSHAWIVWPGGVSTIAFSKKTFMHMERLIFIDPHDEKLISEYSALFISNPPKMVS